MRQIRVLLIDDDDLFRQSLAKELRRTDYLVRTAEDAETGIARLRGSDWDVVLLDIRLPDQNGLEVLRVLKRFDPSIEVVMLTGHGTVDSAVEALKSGAFHYLLKPVKLTEIDATIQKAFEKRALALENRALKGRIQKSCQGGEIVGESSGIRGVLSLAERVAPTNQTVLIQGESGTGKELIARRIHELSPRRDQPFVLLDCAALSKNLLESELFGHEKGAFTGATAVKAGLAEAADRGTLFVDEIGSLDAEVQASFLRLMETREYRRVGSTRTRQVDLRILAATNLDLATAARDGRFREDLFYRLNVIVLDVPPLRERKEDIPLLAQYFLCAAQYGDRRKELSSRAVKELVEYPWPGNVRELKHTIERAALLCDSETIEAWDLKLLAPAGEQAIRRLLLEDEIPSLDQIQSRYIHMVLEKVQGNQQKAARVLGVDPKTIYRFLKKD